MNAAAYVLEVGEPDKVAIEAVEGRITYAELRDRVARAAAAWRSLGVGPDDRVLVLGPDSIGWVVAYLGAIWAGGVAVGLNSRLFERELSVILGESGGRYVWCSPESLELLARCTANGNGPSPVLASELDALLERQQPVDPAERSSDDMALWIYTSGTTGTPKAAVHAHRGVWAATDLAFEVLGASRDDRFYSSSKLFFAYALANSLLAGLRCGATVVLDHEWPTPERVVENVERLRPSVVFVVPTLYLKLLQAGLAPRLANVARFVSAGEKLPAAVRAGWREATGRGIVDAYGASETNFIMLVDAEGSGLLRPTPRTEVWWREPREPGPGRLWIRHPSTALGYWQRPEATADCFQDGCFSPGDVFLAAGEGRFEIHGRQDDMIKISGQWVSVADVDASLIAACGDSLEELGSAPFVNENGLTSIAVFAVAKPGSSERAASALHAAIESLPKQRQPRETHWLDELPRTPTGKLQRAKLLELRASGLDDPLAEESLT
ncbi:MAG TPA: AMP-binding protein [Gaiellaceae bacterium]|nr:AMP-binding protein [Gaiellaceae bacterium]